MSGKWAWIKIKFYCAFISSVLKLGNNLNDFWLMAFSKFDAHLKWKWKKEKNLNLCGRIVSTVSVEILQKTLVNEDSISCHFRNFHLTHFSSLRFTTRRFFLYRSIFLILLSYWEWLLKHLFTCLPQVLNKFVSVYDVKPRTSFFMISKKFCVMHSPNLYPDL